VGFSHIHAFPYSARAGAAAARFPNQVPEGERRARNRRLNTLDAELGRVARQSVIGQTRPVLWENRAYTADTYAAPVTWEGLTDNYLRVSAAFPAQLDMHNHITAVRLTRITGGELWGEGPIPSGTEE
jgi:threonylcarbamoyladenosine tRNA methylthiotransferase MtaB